MSTVVFLLLGSNLGDRNKNLLQAREFIAKEMGEIQLVSNIYESEPWGFDSENQFLNQALKITTQLSAHLLLVKIKEAEKQAGRIKKNDAFYESRVIDIDILLFGNEVMNTAELIIPHPKLPHRMFALIPLAEIAANHNYPNRAITIEDLLDECEDKTKVERFVEKKT